MHENRSFRVEYVEDRNLTQSECRLHCNVATDTKLHVSYGKYERHLRHVNVKNDDM